MTDNPSEYSRSVTWPAPVPLDDAAYSGRPASRVAGSRAPRLASEATSVAGELAATQADSGEAASAGPLVAAAAGAAVSDPNRTWVNSSSLTSLPAVSKSSRRSGTRVRVSSQNRAAREPSNRYTSIIEAGLPLDVPAPPYAAT